MSSHNGRGRRAPANRRMRQRERYMELYAAILRLRSLSEMLRVDIKRMRGEA